LLIGAAVLVSSCSDASVPTQTEQVAGSPAVPRLSYNIVENPWGTYDEIYAASQVDEPDDEIRWRCPEEPVVYRTWMLTLTADQLPGVNDPEYLGHFTFSEGNYFIGYVGRSAGGLPLADYRFYETAYSHDRRFIAQPYGRLTLMCRGTYTRIPAARIWSGQYWVAAHQGEIVFGPTYTPWAGNADGCGGGAEYVTDIGGDADIASPTYDPYSAEPQSCGTGGSPGSAGDTPTFAEICGSLDGKLYYDYLCLDVWNEKTKTYETVWCGTAAFCET
jgi:hypothetical protein